jgi:hypothetical protein
VPYRGRLGRAGCLTNEEVISLTKTNMRGTALVRLLNKSGTDCGVDTKSLVEPNVAGATEPRTYWIVSYLLLLAGDAEAGWVQRCFR